MSLPPYEIDEAAWKEAVRGWDETIREAHSTKAQHYHAMRPEESKLQCSYWAYLVYWSLEYFDSELGETIMPSQSWISNRPLPVAEGGRVGAILAASRREVHQLGYGVFEGMYELPKDIPGPFGMPIPPGTKVPRIKLDDGKTIWGCECWWDHADKVEEFVRRKSVDEGAKVIPSEIRFYRSAARKKIADRAAVERR